MMKANSTPTGTALSIRERHLPIDAMPGAGVLSRERDPALPIDTLIIHSCFMPQKLIETALPPELKAGCGISAAVAYSSARKAALAAQQPSLAELFEFLGVQALALHLLGRTITSPYDSEALLPVFSFYGVSAHYCIDRAGTVSELVPTSRVAFHAGKSTMPAPDNREGVNAFSIGIELIGDGAREPYTDLQYESLCYLLRSLKSSLPTLAALSGHADIAPGRKSDPEGLDWDRVIAKLPAGLKVLR